MGHKSHCPDIYTNACRALSHTHPTGESCMCSGASTNQIYDADSICPHQFMYLLTSHHCTLFKIKMNTNWMCVHHHLPTYYLHHMLCHVSRGNMYTSCQTYRKDARFSEFRGSLQYPRITTFVASDEPSAVCYGFFSFFLFFSFSPLS